MNLNKSFIGGRLTRDVEVVQAGSSQVAKFGVAVNRKFKSKTGEDRESTLFMDCEAWGRTGEIIAQYCAKGSEVVVIGELQSQEWEDKNGGGKRSKIVLNVQEFQFCGGRSDGGSGGGTDSRKGSGASRPVARKGSVGGGYGHDGDRPVVTSEDIPF